MSMASVGRDKPRVIIETADGYTLNIPVYDLNGNPSPINMTPIDPFDQVSIIGDTATVSDRRASQIIPVDQRGGAGTDRYNETEGITTYRLSTADPRALGAIVAPVPYTLVDQATAFFDYAARVGYVGYTGVEAHFWSWDKPLVRYDGATTLTQVTGMTNNLTRGWERAFGYVFGNDKTRIFRSSDGINFTAMDAAALAGADTYNGLVAHDSKLWTVKLDTTNHLYTLRACVSPTAGVAANATFADVASWPTRDGNDELVVKLFVWKDGAGSPVLTILTTRRILMYNPVGGTIEEYADFTRFNGTWPAASSVVGVDAVVFESSNDLYVAIGKGTDFLLRYSPGAGYAKTGPRREGGIISRYFGTVVALSANSYGIFALTHYFVPPTMPDLGDYPTAMWYMNAEGGWHLIDYDSQGLNTGRGCLGGGWANNVLYRVGGTTNVVTYGWQNKAGTPTDQIERGSYRTNSIAGTGWTHTYATTDGGSTLTRKTLFGFTLHSQKRSSKGAFGLDGNCYYRVSFQRDGGGWEYVTQYKDAGGVLSTLASPYLIDASLPFPLRLVVNSGYGKPWYELDWQVELFTTNAGATPVLVTCAPRYTPTPLPHYSYDFVVDVVDFRNAMSMALGGVMGLPSGNSPEGIHFNLEYLDKLSTMVKLTYGLGGEQRTDICEFAMAPQLHPLAGEGRYRISLRSVDTDPSGHA